MKPFFAVIVQMSEGGFAYKRAIANPLHWDSRSEPVNHWRIDLKHAFLHSVG